MNNWTRQLRNQFQQFLHINYWDVNSTLETLKYLAFSNKQRTHSQKAMAMN